jgi:hypothetical protein
VPNLARNKDGMDEDDRRDVQIELLDRAAFFRRRRNVVVHGQRLRDFEKASGRRGAGARDGP